MRVLLISPPSILQLNAELQVLKPKPGEAVSLPHSTNSSHRGSVMLQRGYDSQISEDKGNVTLIFAIYHNMSSILSPTTEEEK